MKEMKNKNNIQPAQKFNPPAQVDCYMDGKHVGSCFVYDAASWKNRGRRITGTSKPPPVIRRAPVTKTELLPTLREMR